MKPYQLSDELEKFLHDQSVVGPAAWNRLFDETMAGLEFEVDGESAAARGDAEPALRAGPRQAAGRRRGAGEGLQGQAAALRADHQHARQGQGGRGPLAQAADAADLAPPRQRRRARGGRRRCATPSSPPTRGSRTATTRSRRGGSVSTSSRSGTATRRCRRRTTARSAGPRRARPCSTPMPGFDPRMAELAEPFFERGWIDAPVKPGKAPGAFAHPTVTEVHPYVLLNYLGKQRDVMTLAHELGHGVHQRLAAGQGELLSSTPLTLAETAQRLRRDADLPQASRRRPDAAGAQDHARLEGRGHDQHRRPPDRLLRLRVPAARRAPQRRADPRRHRRDLDGGADREPRPGLRLHARLRDLLGLHPALHPLAVLRLRLRLRRRPRERALRRLRGGRPGLRRQVLRHARGRRLEAPQGAPRPLRPRRHRPELLGQGPRADRRHDRRARGDGRREAFARSGRFA